MQECYTVLDDILSVAGLEPAPRDRVHIDGADPVLPSNFMIGTAGAAVVSAVGLAAANLWELRTGRQQSVSTDVRRGAMAMRSDRFVHRDGEKLSIWDPISGFYKCRDGRWVQLHCVFPHHRARTVKVLGAAADKESVAAAVSDWDAPALEDALTEAGSVSGMVRMPEEWDAHPQGAAVSSLPLCEIIKLGASDPEPLSPGDRPLSGVRVLDLTRVIAGPMCGRTLAEHGADVMRISGPGLPFSEPLVIDTGYGKLSAEIDLKSAEGRETLLKLLSEADVFSQSYRPGAIASTGFSPEELTRVRPGIIYISLSAYGHTGPWQKKRGFDSLVQCCTGIVHEQSHGLYEEPRHLPAQVLDYATGYLAAFGAMEALRRRALEGGSYLVRVSLAQTAHWIKRLGRIAPTHDARHLPDPKIEDVVDLTMETESSFGRIRHLAPAVTLSETASYWARPPVPVGWHKPVWPAQSS